MNLDENKNKIELIMIIEVIGRPPEHLTETLNDLIKKIGEEKGVNVKEKKLNEPNLMREQEDLYVNFAEVEVEVEGVINVIGLMFKYMPAHIEVIHPEKINLKNTDLNDILNLLVQRLHGYDEVARVLQIEKEILEKKLRELMPDKKEK